MRRVTTFLLAAACAFCQAPQLRVLSKIPFERPPEDGVVRAWLCPSGLVWISHSRGELTLVDGSRESVVYRKSVPELAGVVSGACDENGRIYFSADRAVVKVYSLTAERELRFEHSFEAKGLLNRLLVTGDELYAVGLARIGSGYVFVRKFKLPEGLLLVSPSLKVPVQAGSEPINRFAVEGVIFWHPARQQPVYVTANPLEFSCLDSKGQVAAVYRPTLAGFINAPAEASGNRDWHLYDRVYNAAALADGRVVVQFVTGMARGERRLFLALLDADFRPLGLEIPTDLGLLLGAAPDGTLYFVSFELSGPSWIAKARLEP